MTVAQQKAEAKRRNARARLAGLAREYGIRNKEIAAACEPPVQPSLVSHFFAGRADSSNVERTVRKLIADARTMTA